VSYPRAARDVEAVAGSDYKAVVEIRYKGSMTKSELRLSDGNHLPFAGMPAPAVQASKALCLGRFLFPA
jgi:hypothetical protein